jgi:uncharacterized protein (TIGR03083 family)
MDARADGLRIEEHVDQLRRHGEALAAAAAESDLAARVPTCPGWELRDLLRHLGGVHRWAATYVVTARTTPLENAGDLEIFVGGWPADGALVEWFRDGHAELVEALATAPDDLECWTFLRAPSPRAFWARRQAHETAVHLADGRSLTGDRPAFVPAFAADGVDELLFAFGGRRGAGMRTDVERSLALRATDRDDRWHVRLTPGDRGDVVATRAGGDAECTVEGTASDLYLFVWNRLGAGDLAVDGDPEVLGLWREQVRITWS